MAFFNNYKALCLKIGKTPNGVAKELGIPSSSVTQWKAGSIPRKKTMQKLAEYFGVTERDLLFMDSDTKLYTAKRDPKLAAEAAALLGEEKKPLVNDDEELTELLTRVRDDPHLRMLFSIAKDATAEDVEKAIRIIQALKGE